MGAGLETIFDIDLECEIKETENDVFTVHETAHCDWVVEQMKEIKSLLSYNSDNIINLNKVRALSAIETARKSLYELELYIKSK